MADSLTDAMSCAAFARAEHIDPVGTAGSYHGFVLVEIPLPWPHDVGGHPSVAPVAAALAQAGLRVQAVVPSPGSTADRRRLAVYTRSTGPFRRYKLQERSVAERQLTEALTEVATTAGAILPGSSAPSDPEVQRRTEVLVCSHGKRDACCGTLGTRLVTSLNGTNGARVWRTSHTGGHRFAPTAFVLPEGTAWAYLDQALLEGIVGRTLDIEVAAGLYRGCTGLDHPAVQACEREALRTVGWSWLDHRRSGEVVDQADGATQVRLEHTAPDGTIGAFEATVEVTRRLPVPECRQPLEESRKDAPELAVTSFTPA